MGYLVLPVIYAPHLGDHCLSSYKADNIKKVRIIEKRFHFKPNYNVLVNKTPSLAEGEFEIPCYMGHNSSDITLGLLIPNSNKELHKSAPAPDFEINTRPNKIPCTTFLTNLL